MSDRPNLSGVYLASVINRLAPYFQLTTQRDVSETIALQQVVGSQATPSNVLRPEVWITQLVDLITNTSEGAYSIHNTNDNPGLLSKLNDVVTSRRNSGEPPTQVINQSAQGSDPGTISIAQRLHQLFGIVYADVGSTSYDNLRFIARPLIANMFGPHVARNTTNNNEPWWKCSILKINTPYVNPANKYTEAISVFMNGIPSIEFSRAVPYVEIKFISGREPTDINQRLNAMSIFKFLEGAVQIGNESIRQALVSANTMSGSINGALNDSGFLSTAGMELFTTPQTLINANTNYENDHGLRAVPILDPMRPFLSFKSLTVEITSGGGFFGYKTGKLEFVLHDRSRLSEVADFLKPDLYGTTDIMIEYGWNHPDGIMANNVYADLLNSTRSREKYMIRNVQFQFDDVGQVNITLDIAMRGATDLSSEVIATADDRAMNALRRIQELSELIGQYRSALHMTGQSGQGVSEIRGVQILDAAADYQNNLRLNSTMVSALNQFRTTLNGISRGGTGPSSVAAQNLQNALRELWGENTTERAASVSNQISTTLAQQVREKMLAILEGESVETDPMLPQGFLFAGRGNTLRAINSPDQIPRRAENSGTPPRVTTTPTLNAPRGLPTNVSLAKLLLHFVALPLAATGKYEDVQLIFYPFNGYAGRAKDLSIGSFVVDANFFFEQYMRWRTENVSRAASVNLRDFMGFVASTIIDDPGAAVYGIDSLYHFVFNRDTNTTELRPRNQANFQVQLETRLRNITPNGEFRHPTVQCYVEALPARRGGDGSPLEPDSTKTILRLHFVDRQATLYETQGAILATARNQTLNAVAPPTPTLPGGEAGINDSREQYYRSVLALATNNDSGESLMRNISTDPSRPVYVLNGGPQAVKEFIMKTMPYIMYGVQGTAIKNASLSSMQNADLSTVNMLRSFNASPLRANGEQPGGLPLSIIPCELSMTTLGCNLIEFTQQFFIDFQTGTTADNIYGVNAVTHKIEAGSFDTEIRFVPMDAWGRYTPLVTSVQNAADHLAAIQSATNRTQQSYDQAANDARNDIISQGL